MRGVPDRPAADEADHLRRLVPDPGALGNSERERAVLPDEDLDAADVTVLLRKTQELGPSPGGNRSGGRVLEQQHGPGGAFGETPLEVRQA